MHAEDLVREARLQDALRDLKENVRKQPDNGQYRTFLFQLLTILGEWGQALDQLSIMRDLQVVTMPLLHIYQEAIQCETLRREIFAGRRKPLLLGEPPDWVALLLESLRLRGEGQHETALSLRDQAFERAAPTPGNIDGDAFEWIADADSCLGPIIEAILDARYYWVPFQNIASVSIAGPRDLRDLVWLPAEFTWTNGGQSHGLIPARYPGSELSRDPLIQLGKKTEWESEVEGIHRGLGQRMLATNRNEYPLLDIRQIRLD